MPKIFHIVLTGGPCAGKTTSIAILEQHLTNLGYKVIILDEVATSIIKSGITPKNNPDIFQELNAKIIYERDKAYREWACNVADKIVFIHDRGLLDGAGYCSVEKFENILKMLDISRNEAMSLYDGVFHLVTAADGAIEFYTTTNNTARTETPEEAIEKDKNTLYSWVGHPHLRVIGNTGRDFKAKVNKLIEDVMSLIGEPKPLEIERKYLIEMPTDEVLQSLKARKVEIVQTYLTADDSSLERRLRQRGINGDYTYYYTEKRKVGSGIREEVERKISEKEYITLMREVDTSRHPILKNRYIVVFNERCYEIDIYNMWKDKAVMEIEFDSEDELNSLSADDIPTGIQVIEDITDKVEYSNHALALM